MRRLAVALTVAVCAAVLPVAASGGVPVATVASVGLDAAGGVVGVPSGALLAGVTWESGDPVVSVRVRTAAGWGEWETGGDDTAADPHRAEAARVRPGIEPVWLGRAALAVEVRFAGAARGPRLVVVGERLAGGLLRGGAAEAASTGATRLGHVVPRRDWGAAKPTEAVEYARRIEAVAVHHTVNSNDYAPADAPAMLRSIQAYHQRGRGYSDIAYNLLVDRFGRVYEGRAGGIDRAVVGAHTLGFNDRVAAVAMLGNLDVAEPSPQLAEGVARASAYLSERWGFDPRGSAQIRSDGSPKHRKGSRPVLPRVFGHRDTGATACPGRYAYAKLPALRERAWRLLAPVITGVRVTGVPMRPPAPVTITASLTAPAAWRIEITSPYGLAPVVATGHGRSMAMSWDGVVAGSLRAPPGRYTWTATADDGVHGPSDPATGSFEVALSLG